MDEGKKQKLIVSLRAASGFPKVNDPLPGNNYCGMQTLVLLQVGTLTNGKATLLCLLI